MRIITCNRCGAKLPEPEYENAGYVALQWRGIRTSEMTENPFEDWDLCEDCFNEIEKYIKIKPVKIKQEEKFQKIVESVDAGKKAKKPTAKKPAKAFDKGAAQALRDNGWTLEKIAEELGVSISFVSKNTHPAKPKKEYPNEWAEKEPDLDPVLKGTMESKQHAVLDIVQEEP